MEKPWTQPPWATVGLALLLSYGAISTGMKAFHSPGPLVICAALFTAVGAATNYFTLIARLVGGWRSR
jgi:hypothetical protein